MKKHIMPRKSVLAVLLIASVLTGCSDKNFRTMFENLQAVQPGKTISDDSKWINSDIDGAVDVNTVVSMKDDFHTAVNQEWLLAQKLDDENDRMDTFQSCSDVLREQKLFILNRNDSDPNALNENPAGLSEAQLQHNEEIVARFAEIAGNWEERNAMGTDPIIPYLDAITSIQTLEDMNQYLMNANGMNFTCIYPVEVGVAVPYVDKTNYTVNITPVGSTGLKEDADFPVLTLADPREYKNISMTGILRKEIMNQKITYLLTRVGWSSKDIEKTLANCYRFESRLAEAQNMALDLNEINNLYSFQELKDMEGNYPLTEILGSLKLDGSESYTVWDTNYVKTIGKIYTPSHLEEMKAYYLVHTIDRTMPLLDRECYEKYKESLQIAAVSTEDPDGAKEEAQSQEEKEIEILMDDFVAEYMAGPLDSVYVARYCSKAEKEELTKLTENIVDYYREMLLTTEWLSEETQTNAVEKLNSMKKKILYPDTFPDYSTVMIQEDDTLMDVVANLKDFNASQQEMKVNQPLDNQEWDLNAFPTSQANAFYSVTDNSINIMAGLLSDGFFYNEDAAYEEVLGRIGAVIGHEITHGFDQNGAQFDKDGQQNNWWTYKDAESFQRRITQMRTFYQAITPYPGGTVYSTDVTSEATADMGGMKCMLGLAAQEEDFDYEKFFASYASMWRVKQSLQTEQSYASDVHPLGFLRTNVTLQQFDQFLETFDIQEGDGMYLAPDKRILVW